VQCERVDQQAGLFELDNLVNEEARLIERVARQLRGAGKLSAVAYRQVLAEAKKRGIIGWNLAWSLPLQVLRCDEPVGSSCTTIDYSSTLKTYRDNATALNSLGLKLLKRATGRLRRTVSVRTLRNTVAAHGQRLSAALSSVATVSVNCVEVR
jgi:hypothetical protein